MKTVLCYGDSNTWGCVPMRSWDDDRRFPETERWVGVMQADLGNGWRVIAEGLPGRTTVIEDPIEGEHLSGLGHIRACLGSHRPLDLVVVMLGTNDFKRRFSLEAEDIAFGVERLIEEISGRDVFVDGARKILVVCPPPIEVAGVFTTMFAGADRKSRELSARLGEVAKKSGAGFFDAGSVIQSSPVDGIHFDAAAHITLGHAIAKQVENMAG
jgi:lysophospholipase L1-like esterase